MDPEEIYSDLLKQIEEAFQKSDIKIKQSELASEWNYALCATPIKKNSGIILGINWGGNERKY